MRARDGLVTTPWGDDHPLPTLVKRVARAHEPEGTVPESWVAGLQKCVSGGYLDRPESVIPLENRSYLVEVAPAVMETLGDRGHFGFAVFVAWCSDLRRGANFDFPEVDTRGDQDPEVTILARWLDIALTEPSWLWYGPPRLRRVVTEQVRRRLVSEVPELVSLAKAARQGPEKPDKPPSSSMWDGLALSAIWRWQDAVLADVEGMGTKHGRWYRVLDAWRVARTVTGQPVAARVSRWLEQTEKPPDRRGRRSSMVVPAWRSIRLIHGLSEEHDGTPSLLQVDANEASEHDGAIQVAATLLGLHPSQVAGYWRRRKGQCTGWPLFHRLPVIEAFFLADAP